VLGERDGAAQRTERADERDDEAESTVEMNGAALNHHILTVLVENKFGVLSRVAGLFARRGFNIVSLAVSPTEDERFSRMTIVVDADSAPLEQITKQLNKLIPVLKIAELHPDEAVERELMLVTVKATPELRSQITELASIFQARIDDVGHDALTIQVAGAPQKLDAMTDLLQPFGIIELQRTGRIALPKLARRPAKLRAVKNRAV
jgi:acetolactate synthase-1/3 small subunit